VTAEVTPHHLAFDHRDVGDGDTRFKMMPPLRSPEDVAILRRALAEGIIDAVATDHAPHSADEKAQPFPLAPNGVTGLEWAASVVTTLLAPAIETFFDRMSLAPARIGRITSHGLAVTPGNAANLVVYDPAAEYLAETTRSRSSNAPYLGRRWRGVVRHTLLRGVRTHDLVEGVVP
jgi:dihydroorotase